MPLDTRYDILFEPVRIGPQTAKNRFYQVPHCNGGGYRDPSAVAEMRRVKAEGGWGVIFTEQADIHPSAEITPFIELRLWEDQDIPAIARMAEAMKEHGSLAGLELVYAAVNAPNLYSREVPMAVTGMPIRTFTYDPVQARTMDKADLKALRGHFVRAARRAQIAGFDLLCLYGAHSFGVLQHFLSRTTNQRGDEYGGSLENRTRFLREVITDVKEAVGDRLGVTLRLALTEMVGDLGFENEEVRDVIAMHSDLPDLWDLAHGTWDACSGTSRFKDEDAQADLIAGVKALTDRPVVGVGRYTSPDTMARLIRSGQLDMIGAARPSIADPFLPRKIAEGRVEDIRECIGCNICVTGDMTMALSRCTQNPSFMEEWRKGWHPEVMNPKGPSETVLVVGAGPAGLEAAMSLGRRGYDVALAEATDTLGGRVARERTLPGLSAWGRVADYRTYQIGQMPNVEVYRGSALSAEQVLEFGFEHVCLATGATWRSDGVGRWHTSAMPVEGAEVYTPDDLMAGRIPTGQVILFDDDHYYMGGVLAELCVANGASVTLITPAAHVSEWTMNTLEHAAIHARLADLGVNILLNRGVTGIAGDTVTSACAYTGATMTHHADAVVLVTAQRQNDDVWRQAQARRDAWADHGLRSVKVIGDAQAPAPIAWATYAGHRYARELDQTVDGAAPAFRREVAALAPRGGA